MRILKITILIYLLTVILSANKCRPQPPPATSKPQEKGYFQLESAISDLCNKTFLQQSILRIQIQIFVKEPGTGKPVLWVSPTGYPNPFTYSKADLIKVGTYNDCIFSQVPGDKEFDVLVSIVGDCCKNYGECTTNGVVYWKKARFRGETFRNSYVDINSKGYCIFGIPIIALNVGEDNGDGPCKK